MKSQNNSNSNPTSSNKESSSSIPTNININEGGPQNKSAKSEENYYERGTLPSLDEHGQRVGIIPAEVKGKWKTRKQYFHLFLLFILLAIPWTTFKGVQTILLDIPNRKFTFFGTTLWAHEAPLIFLVLIIFVLILFFVTAVWGRVWCGWACPQTVFIEAVYRRIEIWIEGNYLERRKMNTEPWTASVYLKKSFKWISFLVVSSIIAHSVAAYFIGARELMEMTTHSPASNLTYFTMITFITGLLLFNFGWFREQFCIIMCPYGRFQSALLGPDSMVVQYNKTRGEPRKGTSPDKVGDCVSCNRCVQVCPTGIDIRIGLQMECIHCTACMDACDAIMEKVKKPKGLISYGTQSGKPLQIFQPRAIAYFALLFAFSFALTYFLSQRAEVDIAVLRGIESPYSVITGANGSKILLNHFRLHIKNQTGIPKKFRLSIDQEKLGPQFTLTTQEEEITVPGAMDKMIHFFIKYTEPWQFIDGQKVSEIKVNDQPFEIKLIGPRQ